MSIKKVTLASLILLSLTACSSGGKDSPAAKSAEPQALATGIEVSSEEAKAQLEAAKKAREQAEKAAKEAEVQAKTASGVKSDVEQIANNTQQAAIAISKTKANVEQLNQMATQKLAELTRLTSEVESNVNGSKESLAALNRAKSEAEKLLEEANQKVVEATKAKETVEANAQGKLTEITEATKLLDKEIADTKAAIAAYEKSKAEAQALAVKKAEEERLEKERLAVAKYQEASGFSSIPEIVSQKTDLFEEKTKVGIYTKPYSVVKVIKYSRKGFENTNYVGNDVYETTVTGTKTEVLPNEGQATYLGRTIREYGLSDYLKYDVNFTERTGQGIVDGSIKLSLDKGNIENGKISSTVSPRDGTTFRGTYSLEFFGNNAEEIGGKMKFSSPYTNSSVFEYGLSGTRSEIQK